jgi:hypothetical protein
MTPQPFKCSDHALVRYLERRAGIDIADARQQFLSMIQGAELLDSFRYRTEDGMILVVKDRVIVTII